ncbi:MAG: hypothetical protein ETSY2_27665 [Candidatus Entotheonella gemina]|uniref:Uncharacterized protein n=1 Tax=Candidatus Entotheonella gemina TaxID=1429439 RepID=W4M367_9BACT|nr:MAG: hypothetical protein ETSY2_27665 [Candidatus Entotheonella gemina]
MAEQVLSDERKVHDFVQTMISGLLEFDEDSRFRIHKTVGTFFGFDVPAAQQTVTGAAAHSGSTRAPRTPSFSGGEEVTPKDFLLQKRPNTDIDRVACLAYYLTHYRDTPYFKTVDISKLNTEAAQIKFSNTAYAVGNATKSGLLVHAGKAAKQLSAIGEQYVEALPDSGAAKATLVGMRPRRGRKKVTANNTKSTD